MTFFLGTSALGALALALVPATSGQSIPSSLPGNWTSVGCYTDISTSRTLAGTSMSSDSLTVESCISFCASSSYIYSGVEFGRVRKLTGVEVRECYCDSTIQIPSQPAALSDCNFGCSGNSSELCGSSGRMNLFYSGDPPPTLVPTVADGNWTYQGCYTDTVDQRTLRSPVNIPVGVNAASCTAACQSLDGYVYAGMEIGHECWCDNSLNGPTQRVSDDDCRMVCSADHTEYCGNQDRIAIYRSSTSGIPQGSQSCLSTDVANFTLVAAYKNPPTNGPTSVPLKVVLVEMVPNIVWAVLSACSDCCSSWPFFSLQNSVFFPLSPSNPNLHASSTAPNDGESPQFVSLNPAFPGFQAYCTVEDTTSVAGSPPLLAFGGKADAFSLCVNTTANNRLDVVYSPVTGHPHYSLSDCNPIMIQVVSD